MARVRTPREIIELYWEEVWNKGNVELIREICADPILRHDVGRVTYLSHEDQIARVRQGVDMMKPHFTHEVLVADDRFVSSVWNMTSERGEKIALCSIETFRAENGRFTECWNAPYSKGAWGRVGDGPQVEAASAPDLVDSVEAIDGPWLERMFAAAGVTVPHVAVVMKADPVGNGTSGTVYRLHLAYNVQGSQGAPLTLIAKLPSSERSDVGGAGDLIGYAREVAAYRFFGEAPPMRIPRCLYGRNEGSRRFTLILEDLGAEARPGDQIAGCSIAEAGLVVHELAQLHAAHMQAPGLTDLDWPLRTASNAAMIADVYARGLDLLRTSLCRDWAADLMAVMDAAAGLVAPWLAAERPVTLIHGEARVDNIIFETSGGVSTRACLIDLQQMSLGDPQRDIAYFLSGSLSPEDRRACERDLVATHAAAIRAVDPGYDTDQAWQQYRANAIAGLIYTVASAAVIPKTAHNADLLTALLRRNIATVVDLDGIAAARKRAF